MSKLESTGQSVEQSAATPGDAGADAVWLNAQKAYDNTNLRLVAHAKNWRLAFACAMGIAAICAAGMVYIGSKSKFIPMVLEVDKLGQVIAVKALTGDDAVVDASRSVYREVFDLIEDVRTVSTDRQDNQRRIDRAFQRLTGAGKEYVKSELMKALPNEVGTKKTIQVVVKSALKLTDKSWQVDWEEHSRNLAGEYLGVEKWRAVLQYELHPGSDSASIRQNPIGFEVPQISWQQVIK